MKILLNTYGHSRIDGSIRNSVILTNYSSFLGCKQVADVIDLSPPIGDKGIDWSAVGTARYRVIEADALFCQASVSLEVMQRFKELCPNSPTFLQRDSTHAAVHLRLMKEAMDRHNIYYEHQYESGGHSLLNREVAEYNLATKIYTLSKWVKSSFDEMGMQDKTVQFTSQVAELGLWGPSAGGWATKGPRFTVIAVGQTGLRKGTLDLLEGWRQFYNVTNHGRLIICGLPESGAPQQLHDALVNSYNKTPGLEVMNWVDIRSMRRLYGQSHLLASASVEEGSTMPGVEAPLCGLPMIATRNSGIDLLEHGVTGWEMKAETIGTTLLEAYNAFKTGELANMGAIAMGRARQCGIGDYANNLANALRKDLNV